MTPRHLLIVLGTALLVGVGGDVAEAKGAKHVVAKGETLGALAARYGCTFKELRRLNGLKGDVIRVGQALKVSGCKGKRREGKAHLVVHEVLPGQTLGGIARDYGVSVDSIRRRNGIEGSMIRIGQKLKVMPRLAVRPKKTMKYRVEGGDNCSKIASSFGMSLKDLQRLNPRDTREECRKLQIGDVLLVYWKGSGSQSTSKGRAQAGRLVGGEQLPAQAGYYRRRPRNSWGTNETITALIEAINAVRVKHKKVHDLAVGDISRKGGGKLARHKSHQSGRDVDLGFYFKGQKAAGPKAFISALKHKLDMAANWTLIEALVGPRRGTGRAEYVFLDYRLQKKIYKWAKKHKKASDKELEWIFQYPRGRRALRGVLRHEPGHHDHYHIRFRCPAGDKGCV